MHKCTRSLLISSVVIITLFPSRITAAPTSRDIYSSDGQAINHPMISIPIHPGYGVNINFIPTGEIVKKLWIDDPSMIALSVDGELCQAAERACLHSGATVVHLRQIKAIEFPNLVHAPGGSTLLSIITEGATGRKLYQFQIFPASGKPKFTAINVRADALKPPSPDPLLHHVPLGL
jgi:hypothetical protein